jgi:hypothetical protein
VVAAAGQSPSVPTFVRILRLLLYVVGAFSIFWFFFSFIGVLIGVLLFAFSRDPRWRLHGFVLALCASISEFVAHTATALEPLHLAMRTGPVILASYLLAYLILALLVLPRASGASPGGPAERSPSILASLKARTRSFVTKSTRLARSLGRRARTPLTVVLIAIPVGLWASVSIHLGVLFDNAPRMLWIHAPSTVEPGQLFDVTVQAWDAYERLSATYRGTVRFSMETYRPDGNRRECPVSAQLPPAYTFTGRRRGSDMAYRIRNGKDNGSHRFSARIATPGIHYLLVYDSETRNTYYSNPIEVRRLPRSDQGESLEPANLEAADKGERIFWGDVHSHSGLSDGTGSAAHSFYYARHVACLDFYALTDHGEILMLIPGGFDRLEREADRAYEPGSFVTFQGVEWTQVKTGHYTCIFSGSRLIQKPRLSYLTVPTTDGLWSALDGFTERMNCRALALPHHTTQNSYLQDWTYINPKYVKLAEVTSVHGEFLYEQRHPLNYRGAIDPPPEYVHGSSIVDALRMGKRLILYAASDEHDGHPGHSLSHTAAAVGHQRPLTTWHPRIGHPYPGGLTAVRARELTREAVFSALETGHIFAVSDHGRPLLTFTVNGIGVGHHASATGGTTIGAVQVDESTTARTIAIFLAQDGCPPATRNAASSAMVDPGWRPDWRASIEIIKNGKLLAALPVDRPVARFQYVDRAPVTGAAYERVECVRQKGRSYINRYSDNPVDPDTLNTGGADFYLIRVTGRNGRAAYAGPIWVSVEP